MFGILKLGSKSRIELYFMAVIRVDMPTLIKVIQIQEKLVGVNR